MCRTLVDEGILKGNRWITEQEWRRKSHRNVPTSARRAISASSDAFHKAIGRLTNLFVDQFDGVSGTHESPKLSILSRPSIASDDEPTEEYKLALEPEISVTVGTDDGQALRGKDGDADLAGVGLGEPLVGRVPREPVEVPYKKKKIRVQFNCTEKNRNLWREFFKRHKGEYVLYHPLQAKPGFVGAAFLRIHKRDALRGIEFSMCDPAFTDDGRLIVYEYDGLAFPVSDYFYMFGEQKGSDYEIVSMIFDQAPEPVPDILEGQLLCIGVRRGNKSVVSKPVVLKFRPGGFKDWKLLLGQEFGELELARLPPTIQSKLVSSKTEQV